MKVTIDRAGGYDPALGPRHPDNHDPTLGAHITKTETLAIPQGEGHADITHRWSCSCGRLGPWKLRVLQAKQGAVRHANRIGRTR